MIKSTFPVQEMTISSQRMDEHTSISYLKVKIILAHYVTSVASMQALTFGFYFGKYHHTSVCIVYYYSDFPSHYLTLDYPNFELYVRIGLHNKNLKANTCILLIMKGVNNPHDEIKGSNPSPGAYFENPSASFKSTHRRFRL
jgi:hypothetical protein